MEKRFVTVAAVDWEEYERAAREVSSAARNAEELSEARVTYLGRRAALPQALREVRDPETGKTLNALRERLEAAVEEAGSRITGDELRLLDESLDVTLPGRRPPR